LAEIATIPPVLDGDRYSLANRAAKQLQPFSPSRRMFTAPFLISRDFEQPSTRSPIGNLSPDCSVELSKRNPIKLYRLKLINGKQLNTIAKQIESFLSQH